MSTITFQCYACNQVLKVGADKAGRKAKCIGCGTILTIPMSSPEAEAVTPAAAAPLPPAASPPPRRRDEDDDDDRNRDRKRAKRSRDDDDEDDRGRGRVRDEDDDDDDRPRRRKRDDDDEEDRDRGRGRRRRDEDDDRDEDDRGRRRRDHDEDDDRGRDRKEKAGKPDWGKIAVGMKLSFIGMFVILGSFGLQKLTVIIFNIVGLAGGGGQGLLKMLAIFMMIGIIVMTLGLICNLVGQVFWIFTKNNKNGALGFAIGALSAGAIATVMHLVFGMIPSFSFPSFGGFGGLGLLFVLLQGFMVVGEMAVIILFNLALGAMLVLSALYLQAQGLNLKDKYLASTAKTSMIMGCVSAGWFLLYPILAYVILRNSMGGFGGPSKGLVVMFLLMNMIEAGIVAVSFKFLISCVSMAQNQAESRS